jgi:chemotaxis protein CheD
MNDVRPLASVPARRVVGLGGFAVSDAATETINTHALGSAIAVCLWDPLARVAGLLLFLLPDSAISPERAQAQPAIFANTGIPMLFEAACALGLDKARCKVRLVGGAEVIGLASAGALNVGKRNLLAARKSLWRQGVFIGAEATGGYVPRSVSLRVGDGSIQVTSGPDVIDQL